MSINASVIYSTNKESHLCFNHAVKRAISGIPVRAEIDDQVRTVCVACYNYEGGGTQKGESIHVVIDEIQIRERDR